MHIKEETLDPKDWEQTRELAHEMIDFAVDYLKNVEDRPVWQEVPDSIQKEFENPLPEQGEPLRDVYQKLINNVMPYQMGNIHPRFWMWYMGSGNFTGAMGDFMAAILGSNLGGGNHAATMIDNQVVNWCKQMVGFPAAASGTLVSGGSMANILCLTIARNVMSGMDLREKGVAALDQPLVFYSSDQVHSCHQKGMEVLGLGKNALHKVKTNDAFQIDMKALEMAVQKDRADGKRPICVIANAGAVNTGAIDDLRALAHFCKREKLWFHIDGCIGALIAIAPKNGSLVDGLDLGDSIALDPHKWLHAPFEVGCAIVRNASDHLNTFSISPEYLQKTERGIPSKYWLHHYGMQTSRGFRALKVWLSVQEQGINKFGRLIDQNIYQAKYLTDLIQRTNDLELIAPTNINIVCFRYNPGNMQEDALKKLNVEIMLQLQEKGIAALSDTTVNGQHCLRTAICNHRTKLSDLDLVVNEIISLGSIL